jgi:hypothetical protein
MEREREQDRTEAPPLSQLWNRTTTMYLVAKVCSIVCLYQRGWDSPISCLCDVDAPGNTGLWQALLAAAPGRSSNLADRRQETRKPCVSTGGAKRSRRLLGLLRPEKNLATREHLCLEHETENSGRFAPHKVREQDGYGNAGARHGKSMGTWRRYLS